MTGLKQHWNPSQQEFESLSQLLNCRPQSTQKPKYDFPLQHKSQNPRHGTGTSPTKEGMQLKHKSATSGISMHCRPAQHGWSEQDPKFSFWHGVKHWPFPVLQT